MHNALTDHPRSRTGIVAWPAQDLTPGPNAGVDGPLRAELELLRDENHRLRAENRRLQRALDENEFRAELAARPACTCELTAGTSEGPLRRPA
jgi:hypothetical protein